MNKYFDTVDLPVWNAGFIPQRRPRSGIEHLERGIYPAERSEQRTRPVRFKRVETGTLLRTESLTGMSAAIAKQPTVLVLASVNAVCPGTLLRARKPARR